MVPLGRPARHRPSGRTEFHPWQTGHYLIAALPCGRSEEDIQAEFRYLEQIEATDTEGITALPGARELLEHLNEAQIPWAIVTSGSVPVAHARHKAAGLPTPDVFITAERVKRGKPEPDAFLLGAELLGLAPAECVVVEDAAAGVLAGLNAGSHVIAVNVPAGSPAGRGGFRA